MDLPPDRMDRPPDGVVGDVDPLVARADDVDPLAADAENDDPLAAGADAGPGEETVVIGPTLTPPVVPARPPSRHRSRYPSAILDALIPGLGHLAAGRRGRALLFASPLLLMAVAALWIVATTSGPRLAASLLSSEVIWGLLAAQVLLLASRLIAVGSSLFDPALPRPGRRDLLPIVALLVFVIAPQAYAGYATDVARQAVERIFVEPAAAAAPSTGEPVPDPSFLSTAPPNPSTPPSARPPGDRVTALIVGVDAGVGRRTYLTDTMIVVSLDRSTRTVSMVSIPRDMVDVPMPDGRQYRDKINSLVSYARRNPSQFPGSDGTGFDVLRGALGTLLNMPIDYYAKVDLGGFVRVVDVLGGVEVNVARAFCDPSYDEYGFTSGFSITAGRHRLNGQQALAYARVRKASGESDFTRAARQQEVLSGIRDAIVGGGFLNDPIGLLQALGTTIETNLPRDLLPDLAELATQVGREQTYRAVVRQPLVRSGNDGRGSIQIPDVPAIRELAARLFPVDGQLPSADYALPKPSGSAGSASGSGVGGCAPAPRPSPAATPSPSVAPSPSVEPSPPTEPSASPEMSPSIAPSPSVAPSPSQTATPTPPPTPTPTPAPTPEPSPTTEITPSPSPSTP